MESQLSAHTVGSKVWVFTADESDGEGWYSGEVIKAVGEQLVVKTESGRTATYKPDQCPLQNPGSLRGVEVRALDGLVARTHHF